MHASTTLQDQQDELEVGLRPEDLEGASTLAWQAAGLDQPDLLVFKHGNRTRTRNRTPQPPVCSLL